MLSSLVEIASGVDHESSQVLVVKLMRQVETGSIVSFQNS